MSTASSEFAAIMENNRNELVRIEEFSKKTISGWPRNIAFLAISFALILIFGIFASQIITGTIALIVLVVTAVGLFFGLRFVKTMDPLIRQKTQNMLISKMTSEARRNAVAQLDNQVIKNTERLELARAARNRMGAAIESLRSQINEKNAGKPNYERKKEILTKVENAYEQVKIKLDRAAKANHAFSEKVKEYKEMESFAAQASEAMMFFKNTGDTQLEEMLSLEAFHQIESDFNTALIDIENSVRDISLNDE